MECQNCHREREHGRMHEFHYGRMVSSTEGIDWGKLARIRRTNYLMAGQDSAWICNRCSGRFFSVMLGAYLAMSPVFLALAIGLANAAPDGTTPNFILGSSVCCGLPWLLAGVVLLIQKEPLRTRFGEQYAIRAKREILRRQGYDAFFTTSEYRRMERLT
jgi:hypothetical protein